MPDPTQAAPESPSRDDAHRGGCTLAADALRAQARSPAPFATAHSSPGACCIVEFKTAEHRERFAGTRVVGEESPAVLRCVDEALAPVRFAPAPVQTLTEEYTL
jgi:hypothetical protein